MRKLALFFLLPFFNLYGQEPKKIVDTAAIILIQSKESLPAHIATIAASKGCK